MGLSYYFKPQVPAPILNGIKAFESGQSNDRGITALLSGLGDIYFCDYDYYPTSVVKLNAGENISCQALGFIQQLRDYGITVPIYLCRVAFPGVGIAYNSTQWSTSPYNTFNIHCPVVTGYWAETAKWKYMDIDSSFSIYKKMFDYNEILPSAFLWTHSENDTAYYNVNYTQDCLDLIGALRSQYNPNMLFLFSKRQDYTTYPEQNKTDMLNWQLAIQSADASKNRLISSDGLAHIGDYVHYDNTSKIELGKRYAVAYKEMMNL